MFTPIDAIIENDGAKIEKAEVETSLERLPRQISHYESLHFEGRKESRAMESLESGQSTFLGRGGAFDHWILDTRRTLNSLMETGRGTLHKEYFVLYSSRKMRLTFARILEELEQAGIIGHPMIQNALSMPAEKPKLGAYPRTKLGRKEN